MIINAVKLMGLGDVHKIMNPIIASLLEFNNAFEIPKLENPEIGSKELIELRIKLLKKKLLSMLRLHEEATLLKCLTL